jgi:hypothetical protein
MTMTTYIVIDPKSRLHLREATTEEAVEFRKLNPSSTWERATVVSTGALIDTDNGPGLWFGGAGF